MQELTASIESLAFSSSSFEEFEDGVFAEVCEFGRERSATALMALDDALCAEAPRAWRVKDRRSRTVLTPYGTVGISRRRYIDDDGTSHYLLDEHFELEKRSRVSPAIERSLVKLSATVSFRDAAGVISDVLGAHLSHSTARSLLVRAGERLALEGEAAASDLHDLGLAPEGTEEANKLYCEADGTVIALQGTRRRRGEVKLAVFYTDKRVGAPVAHAGYQASKHFWREASAVAGVHYDIANIDSAVVSGDGARWVRGGLDVVPRSRFLLDPFHIRKAISRACADHAFAARVFTALYEDGHAVADGMLATFAREHPERAGEIEDVRRYLTANTDGLWRSQPSLGTIEGHIDKILACRLKKRGRRWSQAGADAMAHVLAAKHSGRPLPCGIWEAPVTHATPEPHRPKTPRRRSGSEAHVPQGRIVSHNTGESFTRMLRDIAGTRGADC